MPSFHIVRKVDIKDTFRVSRVMANFDVQKEHCNKTFDGELNLPDDWQIGLICGASGTGKSTIANELFGDYQNDRLSFEANSVIDDMPKDVNVTDIQRMFYAVGFGSVPCWLKPYGVLSNGEQMRVRLAKALLSSDNVLFDEFTSVIDRNVAKTLCMALNKSLKRYEQKKFVAVSCHKDIIEYLQPDWIFDTDTMQMSFLKAHDQQNGMKYTALDVRRGQNLGTIII